ncbi:MAG: sigma-70 family RNA polymerase sigma factor, partial [Vicinamibacterales bacterium]
MSIDTIGGMPHQSDLDWEALYDRHARMMYRLTWRILHNALDAEDAVQDAFLQVWRDAAKFDPARGSVEAWLITIARSRALDRLRLRCARSQREKRSESLERVALSPNAAVDDVLIRDEHDR